MPKPTITRTPAATYAWMAISIAFIALMFVRWERFVARGRLWQWWLMVVIFLVLDFSFLLIPVREASAIRRLTRAGKFWAAGTWLLVLVFLVAVVPGNRQALRQQHPLMIASLGLLLVGMLGMVIYKLSVSWAREPLRSIVARVGGGFLVHFEPDDAVGISAALAAIPGSRQLAAANEWSVPAEAPAAAALLQFAKRFDFEFVPQKRPSTAEPVRGG